MLIFWFNFDHCYHWFTNFFIIEVLLFLVLKQAWNQWIFNQQSSSIKKCADHRQTKLTRTSSSTAKRADHRQTKLRNCSDHREKCDSLAGTIWVKGWASASTMSRWEGFIKILDFELGKRQLAYIGQRLFDKCCDIKENTNTFNHTHLRKTDTYMWESVKTNVSVFICMCLCALGYFSMQLRAYLCIHLLTSAYLCVPLPIPLYTSVYPCLGQR